MKLLKRLSVFLSAPILACQKIPLSLTHFLLGVSPAMSSGNGASIAGGQLGWHTSWSAAEVVCWLISTGDALLTFLSLHAYTKPL